MYDYDVTKKECKADNSQRLWSLVNMGYRVAVVRWRWKKWKHWKWLERWRIVAIIRLPDDDDESMQPQNPIDEKKLQPIGAA